MFTEEIKTWN